VAVLSDEFDVAVVGGGPVGLWLACELALAKVKVAVIERRIERVTQSRALGMQGRTLEVFALRGMADRFVRCGRTIPAGHFGGLATPLDLSVFETRFPFVLLLPQAVTEQMLEERALELGVVIRRDHVVETIDARAEDVVVAGRSGLSGFHFAARYVVGADGARSIVRRAAGIEFSGHPARLTMMLADAVLDAPPAKPTLMTIVNELGGMLVVPLGDGVHHRIVVVDGPVSETGAAEPVSLDKLAAAAAHIAGTDFRPRDLIWLSRFTDETRLADHYRKGRILLAGDAAHIHAPMGGQGMNVGIQDAMNLGWKLASVVHGRAPETLLDSYEQERRPVGETLRRNTLAQLGLFCAFDPATLAMRRTLEDLLRIPEANRWFAEESCGFGVTYPHSIVPLHAGWEHWPAVSGHRLRDREVVLNDGSRTMLHQILRDGRWLQLRLAPDAPIFRHDGPTTLVDLDRSANAGLFAGLAAVLVRPDGFIGPVLPASR
jgi:2-polyprenyl-6-methoxyphenol hydroxylase-like FAD-dependent oxidoreductase